jgi:poly(A) polymerase
MIPKVYLSDQHNIDLESIDEDALKVMSRLSRYGFESRLVGGGVRDLLLGKRPKDFDVATSAKPQEIKRIFNNSRIIGKRFKLVHVYFGRGKIVELATFRAAEELVDDELQTLRNDNTYGNEESDAFRRDLTINALFYDAETESIIDYVNGIPDLQKEVIRVIGDPNRRFVEDPVRMIRVVRHAVRAGFTIESDTWEALEAQRDLIKLCAPMRLFEEFRKDLTSGCAVAIVRLLHQGGLLENLLPGVGEEDLVTSSSLVELLSSVDHYHQANEELSFSIFVTGLLVCRYKFFPETIMEQFTDGKPDPEFLDSIVDGPLWIPFGLPRKIKEDVRLVLGLWCAIVQAAVTKKSMQSFDIGISRRDARNADQVALLHRILPSHELDMEVYQKVIETKKMSY